MGKHRIIAIILTGIMIFVILLSGREFNAMQADVDIFPSEDLAEVKMLSDYFEGLKNTPGDTEIYVFEGEEEGGSVLILGGTHPNEPASNLTSILFVENLKVTMGKVFLH